MDATPNQVAQSPLFGVMAEFEDGESLLEAAEKTREAGYNKVLAYSPYRVEGLAKVLGQDANILPWFVLIALVVGGALAYYMQYVTDVVVYSINIGGRPDNAWQAFSIIVFEAGILFAGLTVLLFLFLRSNLPLPYHPAFNAPNFEQASQTRFFLCVEVTDPKFDLQGTKAFLQSLEPLGVNEVQS